MLSHSVSNRLHRSGAIDFNVTFDLRQAQINKGSHTAGAKRMFKGVDSDDAFSVCEGEPLYSVTSKRAKFGGGCMNSRQPISLLSSLNGIVIDSADNDANVENLRDSFFNSVRPNGISVTKWDFRMSGKQGNLFVATLGGLNTIYVDDDVEAGDTIVVDLPHSTEFKTDVYHAMDNPSGLIEWQVKRGMPKTKKTLTVRSMPHVPGDGDDLHKRMKRQSIFENGFYRRGQVIGRCVKGAKKGERCDIVLTGNAVAVARQI